MRSSDRNETQAPGRLTRVLDDAAAVLVQDISEYAFLGFVGAAVAAFAAVVLRLTHTAVGDALVLPMVILMAALTMSAATVAFCRAAENLHPGAAEAMASLASRPAAFMRTWWPLAGALFCAGLVLQVWHEPLAPWRFAIVMTLATLSTFYAFSRSYYAAALATQRVSAREAEVVATALLGRTATMAALGWLPVLAPSLLAVLVAQISGFGPVSSAIAAFVVVMSMPAAAAVMSLLFFEAVREAAGPGARARATHPEPRT